MEARARPEIVGAGAVAPASSTARRTTRVQAHGRLAAIARRQHGIISTADAARAGVSRATLHRLVVDGYLDARFPGVYAISGAPDSPQARWYAAQLSVGRSGVLSHRTAATIHGLGHGLPLDAVHLLVPRARAATKHRGFRLHEAPVLTGDEVARAGLLRVTSAARTLCDLAGELLGAPEGPATLRSVTSEVVRRGLADPARIRTVLGRRGRFPGRAELRRVLDELSPLEAWSRSELESRFLRVTTAGGVAPTAMNHPVRDGEGRRRVLDAVWLPSPVFAELDSQAHHGTWADRNDDIRRENALAVAGFTVCLRFTWQHVRDDPAWVVDTVRRALGSVGSAG
ncbi:MAG: type IV toxin-antitoxin system AbiEi family antitoxin domain-containing protein [Nitriliruptoraceae bacterium]